MTWICEICGYENELDKSQTEHICSCCNEKMDPSKLQEYLANAKKEEEKLKKLEKKEKIEEARKKAAEKVNNILKKIDLKTTVKFAGLFVIAFIIVSASIIGAQAITHFKSFAAAFDHIRVNVSTALDNSGKKFVAENLKCLWTQYKPLEWENFKQNNRVAFAGWLTRFVTKIKSLVWSPT